MASSSPRRVSTWLRRCSCWGPNVKSSRPPWHSTVWACATTMPKNAAFTRLNSARKRVAEVGRRVGQRSKRRGRRLRECRDGRCRASRHGSPAGADVRHPRCRGLRRAGSSQRVRPAEIRPGRGQVRTQATTAAARRRPRQNGRARRAAIEARDDVFDRQQLAEVNPAQQQHLEVVARLRRSPDLPVRTRQQIEPSQQIFTREARRERDADAGARSPWQSRDRRRTTDPR